MKRFLAVLFLMVMLPYATTLAWTGCLWGTEAEEISDREKETEDNRSRVVITERGGKRSRISVEEFLIPALAAVIPADFGPETLKAQAILLRTGIYREMEDSMEIMEEALDMDALSHSQMEKLWGKEDFARMYGNLRAAVRDTEGMYAAYEGEPIEPFFCRAASGRTREGDEEHPYLISAESGGDLLADNFLTVKVFTPRSMAGQINGIPGAVTVAPGQLPEEIQIAERDGAGYVRSIQIGQKTYSGTEVQYALGLSSSCYSFEVLDGNIRVSCKGIGDGYGFSQAGAREYEKEGCGYRWLMGHYFQNVEILYDKN